MPYFHLCLNNGSFIVWVYHILFICCQLVEVWDTPSFGVSLKMLLWPFTYMGFLDTCFCLGSIPRNGIARSPNSVLSVLKNCQTVFQSDVQILPSYQQPKRVCTSLPRCAFVFCHFYYNHPRWCEGTSHHLSFQFSSDCRHRGSYQMYIGHVYVLSTSISYLM